MAAGTKQISPMTGGPLQRLRSYIGEIEREMRLVTWPGREQVRATTIVVLVTVFAFAVFFGVVDYFLALGQTKLYQVFTQ